jgi:hypothetical protein
MIFVTGNKFHWRPMQKIPDKGVITGVVDNGEKFIAINNNTDDNFSLVLFLQWTGDEHKIGNVSKKSVKIQTGSNGIVARGN